jgi:hypothetical protein
MLTWADVSHAAHNAGHDLAHLHQLSRIRIVVTGH